MEIGCHGSVSGVRLAIPRSGAECGIKLHAIQKTECEVAEQEFVDTGCCFLWTGIFAQKASRTGPMLLVPMCGSCGEEAVWSTVQATGHCPTCERDYFAGPVFICTPLSDAFREVDRCLTRWEIRYQETAGKDTQTNVASETAHTTDSAELGIVSKAPPPYAAVAAATEVVLSLPPDYSVSRGRRAIGTCSGPRRAQWHHCASQCAGND